MYKIEILTQIFAEVLFEAMDTIDSGDIHDVDIEAILTERLGADGCKDIREHKELRMLWNFFDYFCHALEHGDRRIGSMSVEKSNQILLQSIKDLEKGIINIPEDIKKFS